MHAERPNTSIQVRTVVRFEMTKHDGNGGGIMRQTKRSLADMRCMPTPALLILGDFDL
jgi:hypothetical protein